MPELLSCPPEAGKARRRSLRRPPENHANHPESDSPRVADTTNLVSDYTGSTCEVKNRTGLGDPILTRDPEKSRSLLLVMLEQKRADDNYTRLLEEQKKTLLLEKQLDAKRRLELETEQLKGKVEVMKHIEGTEDMGVKKLSDELKEMIDDLEEMEQFNRTLMEKERESNCELQQARKELIAGLKELVKGHNNIGLRRMGELDEKIFRNACRKRFAEEEADFKALLLCSKWQDELSKPDWHPFKLVAKDQKMEDKSRTG